MTRCALPCAQPLPVSTTRPDDLIVQAVAAMQTERKPVSAASTAATPDTAIGEIAHLSQPTVINDEGAAVRLSQGAAWAALN